MTIKDVFDSQIKILAGAGISSGNSDLMYIVCHFLKVDPTYIFAHSENDVEPAVQTEIEDAVQKLSRHTPVQYITGEQEFMGLTFMVNEKVLIPRPETELLVEEIITWAAKKIGQIKILDLGTGSGAIGVSLASLIKDAQVVAVDISSGALTVAEQNAAAHHVSDRITFVEGDMLSPDLYSKLNETFGAFDIITSNPPYIPTSKISGLDSNVRDFEPMLALDGGADGLAFYHAIAANTKSILNETGLLIVEAGFDTTDKASFIFELHFANVKTISDYSSIPRLVMCELP